MAKLDLKVNESVLSAISFPVIVDESIDFWEVETIFSPDWSDKTKTLVISQGETHLGFIFDSEDKITKDKHFNLTSGKWSACIAGVTSSGQQNATTPIIIEVKESGYISGVTIPDPESSVYEQLIAIYQELIETSIQTMSENVLGGAKVGTNLVMTGEALGLKDDLSEIKRIKFADTNLSPLTTLQVGDLWREDGHLYYKVSEDSTLDLGRENYQMISNNTGSTIENGSVVYETGSVGASENIRASKFLADGSIDWLRVIGIATEDIPNGADGNITTFGAVGSLNTSGIAVGTRVYASGTTAGVFTGTKPDYPVVIGTVLRSHATTGIVFVRGIHFEQGNATTSKDGLMSAADKTKLDGLSNYTLPTASTTVKGGVKVDGTTITVDENGVASSTGESYTAGDGIDITGNVISATGVPDVIDYTLSELTTFNLSENNRYNLGTRTNQTVNFLTGTDGMTIAYFTGGASMVFQSNGVEITSRKGVHTLVLGTKYTALFDWVNQELTIN